MTVINGIRQYMATCPLLQSLNTKGKIDFLGEAVNSYSIEPVPDNPVVENWIGGGGIRQYSFTVAIKFDYSNEAQMNIENSGFFEKLESWIKEQNRIGNMPDLGEGKVATSLVTTSTGYLYGVTPDMRSGRYQISCRLLYEEY